MKKNIIIPKHYKGIKASFKGLNKKTVLFGCDTEAIDGEPVSLQLYNPEYGSFFMRVTGDTISDELLDFFRKLKLPSGTQNIAVFAHYLSYDLPQMFYDIKEEFCRPEGSFKFLSEKHNATLDVKCGGTFFATIRYRGSPRNKPQTTGGKERPKSYGVRRRVQFIDTARYFPGSLEYLCDALRLPVQKMEKPEHLGEKTCKIDEYFRQYAMLDAIAAYHIGRFIHETHAEFNVPLSVSIAQMAQRIFTHRFMPKDALARLPPKPIQQAFLLSYHGGKNGFYLPCAQEMDGVTELDVVSMYPWAMSRLPDWTEGIYRQTYRHEPGAWGVYQITARLKKCRYPIIPDHDFKYKNHVTDVWVASPELDEAVRCGEIEKMESIKGIIFEPTGDACNPFKDFVDYFFGKKQTETSPPRRLFMKTVLNSLYGKTLQTVMHRNEYDFEYELQHEGGRHSDPRLVICNTKTHGRLYKAGGIFHPPLATWITSLARVKLHQLEHQAQAIDASTDAVKTTKPISEFKLGSGLGDLSIKEENRHCIFLRSKCYIMTPMRMNQRRAGLPLAAARIYDRTSEIGYSVETIVHEAHHGFGGRPRLLLDMWKRRRFSYVYRRMTRLKEAFKRANKDGEGNMTSWKTDRGILIKPFTMRDIESTIAVNTYPGQLELERAEQRGVLPGDIPDSIGYEDSLDRFDAYAERDGSLSKKEQKQELERKLRPILREVLT